MHAFEKVHFRGQEMTVIELVHLLTAEFHPTEENKGEIAIVEYEGFEAASHVNNLRCLNLEGSNLWSVQDHGCALAGEVGELCDILKKLKRIDTGISHNWPNARTREQLIADAADEIGDVMTYLDIVADRLGINVMTAWATKFNKVSDKLKIPYHIVVTSPHGPELAHTDIEVGL